MSCLFFYRILKIVGIEKFYYICKGVQNLHNYKFYIIIRKGVHHCVRSPRLTHWKTDFNFRPRGVGGLQLKFFPVLGHK